MTEYRTRIVGTASSNVVTTCCSIQNFLRAFLCRFILECTRNVLKVATNKPTALWCSSLIEMRIEHTSRHVSTSRAGHEWIIVNASSPPSFACGRSLLTSRWRPGAAGHEDDSQTICSPRGFERILTRHVGWKLFKLLLSILSDSMLPSIHLLDGVKSSSSIPLARNSPARPSHDWLVPHGPVQASRKKGTLLLHASTLTIDSSTTLL